MHGAGHSGGCTGLGVMLMMVMPKKVNSTSDRVSNSRNQLRNPRHPAPSPLARPRSMQGMHVT